MRTRAGGPIALALIAALLAALAAPGAANAQFGERLKKKVQQKIEQKAEQVVECVAGDDACVARAKKEGKTVKVVAADSGAAEAQGQQGEQGEQGQQGQEGAAQMPGQGAWARYDFVPGDRILYFDDFTGDEVGDFPRRMEFKSGALEIVEWKGARWLRATQDSKFYLVLPEALPDRFTIEFDYSIPSGGWVWIYPVEGKGRRLDFGGNGGTALHNDDLDVDAAGEYEAERDPNRVWRARVLGDGKYVKVYLNDRRILNVPNADWERGTKILFWCDAEVDRPTLFGNFRVAAGGRKLYDALAEKGRVATQGILFDFGSDRLRPESTPTLKEIGAMLAEHPELRLMIEGHTDNVGNAQSNQLLSEKRAAAVKAYLVANHAIAADRLETAGFGATKPAAANDTPEGRQTNRRVELVKLPPKVVMR
jgi:outer membrane protein OmpA-like peptidoglycan-associated protein